MSGINGCVEGIENPVNPTLQVKQACPITQTFRKAEGENHRLSGFIGVTETNEDGGSFLATLAALSPGCQG